MSCWRRVQEPLPGLGQLLEGAGIAGMCASPGLEAGTVLSSDIVRSEARNPLARLLLYFPNARQSMHVGHGRLRSVDNVFAGTRASHVRRGRGDSPPSWARYPS